MAMAKIVAFMVCQVPVLEDLQMSWQMANLFSELETQAYIVDAVVPIPGQ
jgi:hypothetical protein